MYNYLTAACSINENVLWRCGYVSKKGPCGPQTQKEIKSKIWIESLYLSSSFLHTIPHPAVATRASVRASSYRSRPHPPSTWGCWSSMSSLRWVRQWPTVCPTAEIPSAATTITSLCKSMSTCVYWYNIWISNEKICPVLIDCTTCLQYTLKFVFDMFQN